MPLDLMKPEYAEELAGSVMFTDAGGINYVPNNAVAKFMASTEKRMIDNDMVAQAEREKIRKSVQNA